MSETENGRGGRGVDSNTVQSKQVSLFVEAVIIVPLMILMCWYYEFRGEWAVFYVPTNTV